jgi:hypothetical protein
MQIPAVVISNVGLRVDALPNGEKMLVIGPLVLALPLDVGAQKWVSDNLASSKIAIVSAGEMPLAGGLNI